LETRMDELLAGRTAPAAVEAAAVAPALEKISVKSTEDAAMEPETRLPVAGYMETHFNKFRGEPGQLDFHRFVLLFGHSFSSRIKFWSELELEHALVEGGEELGEIALEQAYLDFLIKPQFNFRAGMMLTPVGIVNERHEPPAFNGVERPLVETFIIPSTWRELGVGITGELGRGFRYRGYLMGALDATGFSAEEGIRGGRTNGFESSFRNPAKVFRLEYTGRPRLALGTSFYSGHAGFRLESVNPRVSLYSFDGRYSHRRVDVRGLFANVWTSRAGELNTALQREFGFNPNVARQMRGYYLEPAVHVLPRRVRNDLVLFTRYERYDTQRKMPAGFVRLPQFDRSAWFSGVTWRPHSDVALKFDYVFHRSRSAVVRTPDGVNLGIGWWF
ncbi:MAG: hypothetical protein ACRD96_16535, partial [Bryobacteraceae bacterium]